MKYIENGYKEIERSVFIKTYEPFEDGTPATEKQRTAIRNLKSYLKTGDKLHHSILNKKEMKRIEKLTKVKAMKEIGGLIQEVKNHDEQMMDAWCSMPW